MGRVASHHYCIVNVMQRMHHNAHSGSGDTLPPLPYNRNLSASSYHNAHSGSGDTLPPLPYNRNLSASSYHNAHSGSGEILSKPLSVATLYSNLMYTTASTQAVGDTLPPLPYNRNLSASSFMNAHLRWQWLNTLPPLPVQ